MAVVDVPGKPESVTVVLLVDSPPSTGVLPEDIVGAWTGLLSWGVEVVLVGVGVTANMGLNPEANRGLLLLTGAAAGAGLEAAEAAGVPF